jgi:NTP pyrophosphatase (non-canonical NTP hydrolase)
MDILKLQNRLAEWRDERHWKRFHTPQNLAQAISVEAGELLDCFLWGEEFAAPNRERIAEECADVLIYLVQLADVCGVDLETAVDLKIRCNSSKYPVQKTLPIPLTASASRRTAGIADQGGVMGPNRGAAAGGEHCGCDHSTGLSAKGPWPVQVCADCGAEVQIGNLRWQEERHE